ncbi:glycosyltransferase family 2 protein [Leptospira limi]|uniref:Glycosyltransferase family 2 protein n=1 Tax=Leptospira limi TaxID=2950023 RepID=A0ABT3M1I7_9LEPT|nr:glycosyltransferase family 2 protein [Leptospira limi]MCW7463458.1 glycosyltransferase family 2 protein [Leptospira limi]
MQNEEENNILCIIPARDEEEGIERALSGLIQNSGLSIKNFIVVNNASKDETFSVVNRMGINVLDCPQIGYGNACLLALDWIQKNNYQPEYILFCDADGSDDPNDIQTLIKTIRESNSDLVIGSRTLGNAEMGSLSPIQIFGNALTCFLIRIFFGTHYTDMGPLRIIRYQSLLILGMKDTTWGWNIEMHIKALQKNMKVIEIPVQYRKRIAGVSKISGTLSMSLRVGCKILYTFFKLLFFGK